MQGGENIHLLQREMSVCLCWDRFLTWREQELGVWVIHLGHSPTGTCVKSVTLISCNELDIIIHTTQHFRLGFFVFGVSSG